MQSALWILKIFSWMGSFFKSLRLDTRHSKTKDPSLNLFRFCRFGGEPEKFDLLSAFRRLKIEFLIGELRRYVPVSHDHREFWLSAHLLRGDNELARQRLVAVVDPDLPVDFPCAKR